MSISKEIFGIERLEKDQECPMHLNYKDGVNHTINKIDEFEISEEELAKIITSEYYPCDERATLLARQIKDNQSKLFVRKNK